MNTLTQSYRVRSGLLRTVLSLLMLTAALVQCGGDPLIILHIAVVPASITKLTLRTHLNDDVQGTREVLFEMVPSDIAVHLRPSDSGQVHIDLFGQDTSGCKLARQTITVDVPGGLSRSTELAVPLELLLDRLCTLTVSIANGSGTVKSNPPGIDCGNTDGSTTCTADFVAIEKVQLIASTTDRSYPTWSDACTPGEDGTCTVVPSATMQVQVDFRPLICSAAPAGWCQQNLFPKDSILKSLRAVMPIGTTSVIAVGDGGTILKCSTGSNTCTKLQSDTIENLTAVWVRDDSNFYAVGDGGTILSCAVGSSPCTHVKTSAQSLSALWGGDPQYIYAVGADPSGKGTVVQCGAMLSGCRVLHTNSNVLKAVWGSDPNSVYAVGNGGTMVQCGATMNSCTALPSNTIQNFNTVWGIDASNVYSAGYNGSLVRCEHGLPTSSCTTLNPSSTQGLNAVWGSDANNVYVVDYIGSVVRCSAAPSRTCTPLKSPMTSELSAVWGGDVKNFYAVGKGGAVLSCAAASNTCTALSSGTTQNLNAVSGIDANNVYAVGDSGVVLRHFP